MSNDPVETQGSVARVRAALASHGLAANIREFDATTRTSADAAAAIGCEVAQIAKTLVFKTRPGPQALLVIASGANRVDERKLEAHLGGRISKADPEFVRQHTGFAIGGVAPVGHANPLKVLIDADLGRYREIWAAAGSPNAVFKLTPDDLARITGGVVLDLKQ